MKFFSIIRRLAPAVLPMLILCGIGLEARANPAGGTVAQGAATFTTSGSQLTIHQTSPTAFINWQSFNIDLGETTTFNQPTAASVIWNQINDSNPSQILGSLNANGYVILQNSAGFYVGGQAAIRAHGLVMTTASAPALNLGSGGPWAFSAPPPTAKIINYGTINIDGGGSAFVIADDIENHGTISAPGGNVGLYAGEEVLVSMAPDGRGLSAKVTLPQGSVDNEGRLAADGGSIALQAQMVNQDGVIQADSAKDVNGTIELLASKSVSLGASSDISANGDSMATSPSAGGSVTIKAGESFADTAGSAISVAGGARGGDGGRVEICAPEMGAINSVVSGQAADGFSGGNLTIDPVNVWLASANTDPGAQSGYTVLNVNNYSGMAIINVQADDNIALNTIWSLPDEFALTKPASLTLSAGKNIIFESGSGIRAGKNWNVSLNAGTSFVAGQPKPASGSYGIYLDGNAYLQAQDGKISLTAANEVQVGWSGTAATTGSANSGTGYINTLNGGEIDVTATYGDVNTGSGSSGFQYLATAPYFEPSPTVGGISTVAGGNVNITAGGNVVSFPADLKFVDSSGNTTVSPADPGTGAFGSEAGNVTINAGGSVYGNFVLVNGVGTINAVGDIGSPDSPAKNVALSLITGGWTLNAGWNPVTKAVQSGVGSIYLQEVRNPNGLFNSTYTGFIHKQPTAGNHFFDYDPNAYVTLKAGNAVNLVPFDVPRPAPALGKISSTSSPAPIPVILPPILTIVAGPGGVNFSGANAVDQTGNAISQGVFSDNDIALFPSPYGNLSITTMAGGNFTGHGPASTLLMSDSSATQWTDINSFSANDHAAVPADANPPMTANPVTLDISGDMNNVYLQVNKPANITVHGNWENCGFYGENLNAQDATTIHVYGNIAYDSAFTSVTLPDGLPDLLQLSQNLGAGYSLLGPKDADNWYEMLLSAVNYSPGSPISADGFTTYTELKNVLSQHLEFPSLQVSGSQLLYNPATRELTVVGDLNSSYSPATTTTTFATLLESGTLYLPVYKDGVPLLDSSGNFVINQVNWLPADDQSAMASLAAQSQGNQHGLDAFGGLIVGGPGTFNVTAGCSINLGTSRGILSLGEGQISAVNYSFLAPYMSAAKHPGADINVVANSIEMPGSTIASMGGGGVNVTTTGTIQGSPLNGRGIGVSMDLGNSDPNFVTLANLLADNDTVALGIFTSAGGNVNITASGPDSGSINVDASRIGTFDGGDILVRSDQGDVNAGSISGTGAPIETFPISDPALSQNNYAYEFSFGNGIVAQTLLQLPGQAVPGAAAAPGNITVLTPEGDISADKGGILQLSLGGPIPSGPFILLEAGTPNPPDDWKSQLPPTYIGNISLGNAGAIGATIIARATGKISGRIIAAQNADVTSQTVDKLTVLAGRRADVSAQNGGRDITVIGGQSITAQGLGAALLLGQNVNTGSGAHSTLGTSVSAMASSQSAAQQAASQAKQQVASSGLGNGLENKKKKSSELVRIGRVTVILPKAG